jgi:hypothetical protein
MTWLLLDRVLSGLVNNWEALKRYLAQGYLAIDNN